MKVLRSLLDAGVRLVGSSRCLATVAQQRLCETDVAVVGSVAARKLCAVLDELTVECPSVEARTAGSAGAAVVGPGRAPVPVAGVNGLLLCDAVFQLPTWVWVGQAPIKAGSGSEIEVLRAVRRAVKKSWVGYRDWHALADMAQHVAQG